MVHGENRIPYWIDRRLTGLAGPEYHAIISFGLPIEPEDSQYGKYRTKSSERPHAQNPLRRVLPIPLRLLGLRCLSWLVCFTAGQWYESESGAKSRWGWLRLGARIRL